MYGQLYIVCGNWLFKQMATVKNLFRVSSLIVIDMTVRDTK